MVAATPGIDAVRTFWNKNPLFAGELSQCPGEKAFFEEHPRDETCGTGRIDVEIAASPAGAWHHVVYGLTTPSGVQTSAGKLLGCPAATEPPYCQAEISTLLGYDRGAVLELQGGPEPGSPRYVAWVSHDATPLAKASIGRKQRLKAVNPGGVVAVSVDEDDLEIFDADGTTRFTWGISKGGIEAVAFGERHLVVLVSERDSRKTASLLRQLLPKWAPHEVGERLVFVDLESGKEVRRVNLDLPYEAEIRESRIAMTLGGRLIVARPVGITKPSTDVVAFAYDVD
jgi:hypothetical protein